MNALLKVIEEKRQWKSESFEVLRGTVVVCMKELCRFVLVMNSLFLFANDISRNDADRLFI